MDKISTIKENIFYFIEKQGISKVSFYEKTGISASNFKGAGLKSEIGGDKIVKILTMYSDLNPEWLLTGKGSMLRKEIISTHNYDENINYKDLADSRLETIELLRDKIINLNSKIKKLEQQESSVQRGTVEFLNEPINKPLHR